MQLYAADESRGEPGKHGFRLPLAMALVSLLVGTAGAQRFLPTDVPSRPRVVYADSLVSLNDRCPVRQSTLGLGIPPLYINGQPLGFCCPGCRARFVKTPEFYLRQIHLEVHSLLDSTRLAPLDSMLRREINQEFFYFADRREMKRFDLNPVRYLGPIVDPVSETRFRPTRRSRYIDVEGHRYYFSADSTRNEFVRAPELYQNKY